MNGCLSSTSKQVANKLLYFLASFLCAFFFSSFSFAEKDLSHTRTGNACPAAFNECYTETSPHSTFFSPQIKVHYETKILVGGITSDTEHLGISECKFLDALRVCARISLGCRKDPETNEYKSPDPGGSNCQVYEKELLEKERPFDEDQYKYTYVREWKKGQALAANEEVIAGPPRLCAFEDPKDGMDTDTRFSPFHENTKRKDAMDLTAGLTVGGGMAAGLMVGGPVGVGIAVIGATVLLADVITSSYNHVVTRLVGCQPIALGPMPPPFAQTMPKFQFDEPAQVVPLPGDTDKARAGDASSTFENPKARVTVYKGKKYEETFDVALNECKTFPESGRTFCAKTPEDAPDKLCVTEELSEQSNLNFDPEDFTQCIARAGYMPLPRIENSPNSTPLVPKAIISLGDPKQQKVVEAKPNFDLEDPYQNTCANLYGVKLCAYQPCLQYSSDYKKCENYDEQICVKGYLENREVVAKKLPNYQPGPAISKVPNIKNEDDIWVYDPPIGNQCIEFDDDGECVQTSNPTVDSSSEYYIGDLHDKGLELRPITASEAGMCTDIAYQSEDCTSSGICFEDYMALWLDAQDFATIQIDENGKVEKWLDKSNNEFEFVAPDNVENKPTFNNEQIEYTSVIGRNATTGLITEEKIFNNMYIKFDGNDYLSSDVLNDDNYQVFIVYAVDNPKPQDYVFYNGNFAPAPTSEVNYSLTRQRGNGWGYGSSNYYFNINIGDNTSIKTTKRRDYDECEKKRKKNFFSGMYDCEALKVSTNPITPDNLKPLYMSSNRGQYNFFVLESKKSTTQNTSNSFFGSLTQRTDLNYIRLLDLNTLIQVGLDGSMAEVLYYNYFSSAYHNYNDYTDVKVSPASSGKFVLGAPNENNLNLAFDGRIAEIIIYKQSLSDEQIKKVKSYLTKKWMPY